MTLTSNNIPLLHDYTKLPSWLFFQMLSSEGRDSSQLYIPTFRLMLLFIHRFSEVPAAPHHLLSWHSVAVSSDFEDPEKGEG